MDVTPHNSSHATLLLLFLYGALFNVVSDLDYKSLLDYGLKAVLGGVVWLLFKLMADRISRKKDEKAAKAASQKQDDDE